jgi:hypothetical protein
MNVTTAQDSGQIATHAITTHQPFKQASCRQLFHCRETLDTHQKIDESNARDLEKSSQNGRLYRNK